MVRILDNRLWGKFSTMSRSTQKKSFNNNYLRNNDTFNDVPENDWLIVCQKMISILALCTPCRQKDAEVINLN